ncbi:MAG: dephospho-CoA kinase [Lachnospiraceae bacterium]|nr:dephospho-CoA kinase [Lachnospiraceae bacterium]
MVLGITGGVGSGKSTVLQYLKDKYNALIIEADKVAFDLSLPGTPGYDAILKNFPELNLLPDKSFDRRQLSSIVFNDDTKLNILNSIIHPLVKEFIVKTIDENKDNNLIVIEAALLIEDGYNEICDEIWYVYCKLETRIKRLYESRNYSRQKSLEIISNQLSEEEYRNNTDHTIDNSSNDKNTFDSIDILLAEVRAHYFGKDITELNENGKFI